MAGNQEQKDAVTIGQIRNRYTQTLESEIQTLCALIRKGYYSLPDAKKYLDGAIAETLTKLQNLDAMASTEVICGAVKNV